MYTHITCVHPCANLELATTKTVICSTVYRPITKQVNIQC